MIRRVRSAVVGPLLLLCTSAGLAQPAPPSPDQGIPLPPISAPAPPPATSPAPAPPPPAANNLELCLAEISELSKRQALLLSRAADDEQKKKLELLQKQIEVLKKIVDLLVEQMKKQPAGEDLAKVETQAATLEVRSIQAARRDQELALAVDDLREHIDAQERYGPLLPAPLKELFLPSGTNETPLSIYGALSLGYSKIVGNSSTAANGAGRPSTPGGFYFGEFTPDFLLKLNDWIFLSAEIGVAGDGSVSVGSFAEADFFINDWLTIQVGRMVAPIGFYNLRLNTPWINKLPSDAPGSGPLLWQQVLPAFSLLGVQASGAFYLGCSPIKMEYNLYVSNGLNLTPAAPGAPTVTELANLQGMTNTFSIVTDSKLVGGRLGLWWPEVGLAGGVSGLYNGRYVAGGVQDAISLGALDLSYHHGNWDVRGEYGMTYQGASTYLNAPIRREGFYAQVAYRDYDAPRILRNFEGVYRYSYVTFPGIDANQLDLTAFGTPMDVPVRRQQNEFGLNYYFYPRMVLKVAYQINDEPRFHLHDNQFIAELDWGW